METKIAENIRAYRKQCGLTQEQLAEVLGVSVGAVYKWESGSSLPELRLIMEMADYFDVSVDALLGYRMKDNRLNAAVERLWKANSSRDYEALSEAEKMIRKYPHSFEVVYAGAFLYFTFAAETKKESWLRRAIELLDEARLLLPQCKDPRVNESVLCGMTAQMHELLGETDKALELLKTHNAGAIFNDMIGIALLSHGRDPEEANGFLEDGFLRAVSSLIRCVIGYAMLFDVKDDSASGREMISWIIPTLEGLKKTDEPNFLDKMIAVFDACLAIFQFKCGNPDDAAAFLRQAKNLALAFDAAPNYEANRLKYVRGSDLSNAHDPLGKTAMDALENVLHDKDPELLKLWERVRDQESPDPKMRDREDPDPKMRDREDPDPEFQRICRKQEEAQEDFSLTDSYQAGISDVQTVAELACELWPGHTADEMAEEYRSLLAREDAAVFLYRKRGKAVGFAQCQLRRDYVEGTQTSPVGYLEGIYIRADARRHGIARKLLSSCESWAKAQGCTEFASDCELNNTDSQRFHRAAGFGEANRIVAYVKKL